MINETAQHLKLYDFPVRLRLVRINPRYEYNLTLSHRLGGWVMTEAPEHEP